MKVEEVAPFFFRFKSARDKNKSQEKLVDFLKSNDWINDRGDKNPHLEVYHSDENGECYVLLADEPNSEDIEDLVNELFDNFVNESDIEWVKVKKNRSTEGIIYNNSDKYPENKPIINQGMPEGASILVFKRM
ncbi:MAG: hypothetical protein K2H59_02005 [Muribaculaceae bacterium]|nr:hypothetical protein [Muribaculaceae bacterium]